MLDQLVNIFDDLTKNGRLQELAQLADEYRLDFQKRLAFGRERTELKGFKIFSSKGTKRFLGVISEPSTIFKGNIRFYDYLCTRDLETKTTSIIELYAEEMYMDYVKIEPKSTFAKMKGFFMSGDTRFKNLPDFHQNFQISTRTEHGDLWLKEGALSTLINYPGITIEAEGNSILFYYRKKETKVNDIIPMIDFAADFYRLLFLDATEDFV